MRICDVLTETKTRLDPKCWKGKKIGNPKTKIKGGVRVNNCVPAEGVDESYLIDKLHVKKLKVNLNQDISAGDVFFIEAGDTLIETTVVYESNGRILIDLDDTALKLIESNNYSNSDLDEAKYHGKEVPLGKRLPGDVKKSKVYVRKPNGKIVKVNFGDKKMRIKKSNPKRRKSFRARHNCDNPGPRWRARYWSCRAW